MDTGAKGKASGVDAVRLKLESALSKDKILSFISAYQQRRITSKCEYSGLHTFYQTPLILSISIIRLA